jgi:dTDP-4-amino-4,6-dideoxy-D-galactose acyltransferase
LTVSENPPAVYLDWDSAFFNKRIGRVLTHSLTNTDSLAVDKWAAANRIDCVYYLADGSDLDSPKTAESHGYHLMDLRVTYQYDLDHSQVTAQANNHIRNANEEDLPFIRQMVRENHTISRFFADEHFEREKCMELYEAWIERDFREKNHFLWVIEEKGLPVAYTSAGLDLDNNTAEIGLVGVHPDWRGQGNGLKLQVWVLDQLKTLGARHVEVVTQGRNINAQNLYQRSGYQLKSIDLWYHKWY